MKIQKRFFMARFSKMWNSFPHTVVSPESVEKLDAYLNGHLGTSTKICGRNVFRVKINTGFFMVRVS